MEAVLDGKDAMDDKSFRALYSDVMTELHEEGYFLAAKLTPPTRYTDLRKIGKDAEVARLTAT